MKKQLKNFAMALVAGMITLTTAMAADPIETSAVSPFEVGMYRVVNSMKINLMIEKTEGVWVEIRLKNEKNEVIYTEVVNKRSKNFAKKFDLAGLEDGKYRFEITNGKETIVKEVNLGTRQPNPADYRTVEVK